MAADVNITSNIKLLTLPSPLSLTLSVADRARVYAYARANVEASTKYYRDMLCQNQDDVMKLSAETEALREEIAEARDGWHMANGTADLAMKHRDEAEAHAERLAEALQWYVDNDDTNDGQEGNEFWLAGRDRARRLLEQEK